MRILNTCVHSTERYGRELWRRCRIERVPYKLLHVEGRKPKWSNIVAGDVHGEFFWSIIEICSEEMLLYSVKHRRKQIPLVMFTLDLMLRVIRGAGM